MPKKINWGKYLFLQPLLGLHTSLAFTPTKGNSKKTGVKTREWEASCREELLYDIGDFFTHNCCTEKRQSTPSTQPAGPKWKQATEGYDTLQVTRLLNLDTPATKQPFKTYLYYNSEDIWVGGGDLTFCQKNCCQKVIIETVDAVVGLACLLLNEDRYVGDWWHTSIEEAKHGKRLFKWYGTDNFFLRHPVLVAAVMGLFRHALNLHNSGLDGGLSRAAPREEVVRCLDRGDVGLARRLVQRLKPWIQYPAANEHVPFSGRNFDLLMQLHRAIYKYGYDETFGGTLEENWNFSGASIAAPNGLNTYFGNDRRGKANKERLAKLAK